MSTIVDVNRFIKEKGEPLAAINPGSSEFALLGDNALEALLLFENSATPVIGGDILSKSDGKLIYAYQLWGSMYHSLNWSIDGKGAGETEMSFAKRSHELARQQVNEAMRVAADLGYECYITFVY